MVRPRRSGGIGGGASVRPRAERAATSAACPDRRVRRPRQTSRRSRPSRCVQDPSGDRITGSRGAPTRVAGSRHHGRDGRAPDRRHAGSSAAPLRAAGDARGPAAGRTAVVDIGCGPGGGAIAGFNRTNPITGVDLLAPERVRLDQPNFRYVQADATDLAASPTTPSTSRSRSGSSSTVRPEGKARRRDPRDRDAWRRRYASPRVAPRRLHRTPLPDAALFALAGRLRSAAIRRSARLASRRPDGQWQRINWLSAAHGCACSPTQRAGARHWYGPLRSSRAIEASRTAGEPRVDPRAGAAGAKRTTRPDLPRGRACSPR